MIRGGWLCLAFKAEEAEEVAASGIPIDSPKGDRALAPHGSHPFGDIDPNLALVVPA